MILKYIDFLKTIGRDMEFSEHVTNVIANGLAFLSLLVISVLLVFLARLILKLTVYRVIVRTPSKYDDQLINNKVLMRLCYLIPSVMVKAFAAKTLVDFPEAQSLAIFVSYIYDIIMITVVLFSVVNVGNDIYNMHKMSKMKPITGLVQTIKIILVIFCVLLIISFLMGKKLSSVIIGLGTLSAVLILIFQNTILGLVGSIQLTLNDMLRIGDVISKDDAEGKVLEINLTTVKVQNWDNSVTTVPTYSLVTDQFTNYRNVKDNGGRRVTRSIIIDIDSVRFCTPEMIERFRKIECLKQYIDQKEEDIAKYNKENNVDTSNLINGPQQTNLGVFRAYVNAYLNANDKFNQENGVLVHLLQPKEYGIPMEIYGYTTVKDWDDHETMLSDVFDHIIASAPMFDIKIYQRRM